MVSAVFVLQLSKMSRAWRSLRYVAAWLPMLANLRHKLNLQRKIQHMATGRVYARVLGARKCAPRVVSAVSVV